MRTFSVPLAVADESRSHFETIDAIVDAHSSYTWLPRIFLEHLGHAPELDRDFELDDGRRLTYGVKWIAVGLKGTTHTTPIIFAESVATAVLGQVTLNEFGLAVDDTAHALVRASAVPAGHQGV